MKRKKKPDDQENIERGLDLIRNHVKELNIEPSLWISICMSLIVESYINNGLSYDEYENEMIDAVNHYKKWFT